MKSTSHENFYKMDRKDVSLNADENGKYMKILVEMMAPLTSVILFIRDWQGSMVVQSDCLLIFGVIQSCFSFNNYPNIGTASANFSPETIPYQLLKADGTTLPLLNEFAQHVMVMNFILFCPVPLYLP